MQKRAFDEVTICRRATEEALTALAQHFPTGGSVRARRPAAGVCWSARQERSTATLPAGPARGLAGCCEPRLKKPSIKRAMTESDSGTKNQTTDLLVSLVTRAFRRKLRAVLRNEQPLEHLSPGLILEACPTLNDYGQPIRDVADIVAAGRYLRASLGAHESAWKEAVEEIGARQGRHLRSSTCCSSMRTTWPATAGRGGSRTRAGISVPLSGW